MSFFWISAVLNPESMKTFDSVMNTVMMVTMPKSSTGSLFARMTETTKPIP